MKNYYLVVSGLTFLVSLCYAVWRVYLRPTLHKRMNRRKIYINKVNAVVAIAVRDDFHSAEMTAEMKAQVEVHPTFTFCDDEFAASKGFTGNFDDLNKLTAGCRYSTKLDLYVPFADKKKLSHDLDHLQQLSDAYMYIHGVDPHLEKSYSQKMWAWMLKNSQLRPLNGWVEQSLFPVGLVLAVLLIAPAIVWAFYNGQPLDLTTTTRVTSQGVELRERTFATTDQQPLMTDFDGELDRGVVMEDPLCIGGELCGVRVRFDYQRPDDSGVGVISSASLKLKVGDRVVIRSGNLLLGTSYDSRRFVITEAEAQKLTETGRFHFVPAN